MLSCCIVFSTAEDLYSTWSLESLYIHYHEMWGKKCKLWKLKLAHNSWPPISFVCRTEIFYFNMIEPSFVLATWNCQTFDRCIHVQNMSPPVIVTKCCNTLRGCEKCVSSWIERADSPSKKFPHWCLDDMPLHFNLKAYINF